MGSLVRCQCILPFKFPTTSSMATNEFFLSFMCCHVRTQGFASSKGCVANRTWKGSCSAVNRLVLVESLPERKTLLTKAARIRFLASMNPHVPLNVRFPSKYLLTLFARETHLANQFYFDSSQTSFPTRTALEKIVLIPPYIGLSEFNQSKRPKPPRFVSTPFHLFFFVLFTAVIKNSSFMVIVEDMAKRAPD
jgi:hypothetical protein